MKYLPIVLLLLTAFVNVSHAQTYNDAALGRVINDDRVESAGGELPPGTLLYRADVYMANRHFPEAREHWMTLLDRYPSDPNVPRVLFGIARSYMWERNYEQAVAYFDRLFRQFPDTEDGRNGLNYKGASYVRWGRNREAADTYKQYAVMYPTGERIDSAYLNIIDALRETGDYDEARQWVAKTVARFRGTPVEVNALHAGLRMEIFRRNWDAAIEAADELIRLGNFNGSMAGIDEIRYLKAFALENAGRRLEARGTYLSIPDGEGSYFGGLATDRARLLGAADAAAARERAISGRLAAKYPVKYRSLLLKAARANGVDPRFLLAVMMQESSFRARAKSPAAARGLLQLVYDTAMKYSAAAGYPRIQPDDLYDPATNIAIGSAYVADLKQQFGGLYEAIAVSYNAGEDNSARWLDRTRPKDPGVFVSEVGFAETKNYVRKVMGNYRVYRELYSEDLSPR